ncbi:glycosyltransferase [Hyphomicrobium sp.]|uniref:glycosyltransferase family 2 protein n=1 Tax=Hyphomicrobium sp. TaxID=82 RepID=UPI0025B922B6|nr:glycosyltransferase [Hyphomicrobium sp.]MCC7252963.1 glycosyltransferase [Hyphomicrobium sp.]
MQFDAPVLEVLAPLLMVVGAVYVLGPLLDIRRSSARLLIFGFVWLIVARYLIWRVTVTVLPASGTWYEVAWIWLCFAIEMFALFDALILYLCFLRTSDRRDEADAHEARLRGEAPEQLPSVDVYIPTYSEPLEVLEKTITGALCLDYPDFAVWVLDDGKRPWLKAYCEEKGVGYITRPDNAHAKAGNINHALTKTDGQYVALFDADFVVQRDFLMRTMGFFADPGIGIVQVPHTFYNADPLQTNLAVRKTIPDDQRFFFEAIMPSRDGWDAAFCCGSNSVTRREALRAIGDKLPTESLTEDMLLSLKLLRAGYLTRYLNERLAFGLAPEGLRAFFIQRSRWARGAMQILFLRAGPLGPGLSLMQRLLFLPTHWLSQSLSMVFGLMVPIVFMWTGVLPMVNVTIESVLVHLLPMILAVVGGICLYAPQQYFPLASQVLGVFQSFRLLPTLLVTLAKPFGHTFKVTPKGGAAGSAGYDSTVFWIAAGLMVATMAGILVNLVPEWRIVQQDALLSVVATWGAYNILLLFLACMLSLQGAVWRGEERFEVTDPVWIMASGHEGGLGRLTDISLTGASVATDITSAEAPDEPIRLFVPEVGALPGRIVRRMPGRIGVAFDPVTGIERDLLIRKLFTSKRPEMTADVSAWSVTGEMVRSIWATPSAATRRGADRAPDSLRATPEEKLPARSLVVPPRSERHGWDQLVTERRAIG